MPLQIPPIPNFNVNIPQMPDILQKQMQLATLKNMLSEQSLRQSLQPLQVQEQQAKVQQMGLQTQQQQMQIDSQKFMMNMVANGELNKFAGVETSDGSGFDAAGAYQHMMSTGKILPEHASQLINSFQTIGKNQSEIFKNTFQGANAQAELQAKGLKVLADSMGSVLDAPVSKFAEVRDAFKQELVKNPKKFAGVPQQDLALAFASADTPEHFQAAVGAIGVQSQLADFHKSKAAAAKEEQGVIGPSGISPEAQQQVLKDVAVSTNPQIQQGKIDVAKAEGNARAQVQLAMEPLRLQIQQQFGNQKDARDKIETSVLKPFQDKMTDINMAKTAIAQAADNPVAARAAVFKMVGVAQPSGSHRVLPMEFAAFKYPGGLSTQAKEHFNDWLKGSPWTPDIAQAANAFIDGQAQAAQQNLNSGVDNVNKLYNTNVGGGLKQAGPSAPAAIPANVSKALSSIGPGRHTLSDGSVWDKHVDGTIVKAQ